MISLLGIAGETGTLLAEFKKKIRDRESYEGFKDKAEEEIGRFITFAVKRAGCGSLRVSVGEDAKPTPKAL